MHWCTLLEAGSLLIDNIESITSTLFHLHDFHLFVLFPLLIEIIFSFVSTQ